jgi:hypothetical protein
MDFPLSSGLSMWWCSSSVSEEHRKEIYLLIRVLNVFLNYFLILSIHLLSQWTSVFVCQARERRQDVLPVSIILLASICMGCSRYQQEFCLPAFKEISNNERDSHKIKSRSKSNVVILGAKGYICIGRWESNVAICFRDNLKFFNAFNNAVC